MFSGYPVEMKDVVKHVLQVGGCRLCIAFMFDTFPLIANEVDLLFLRYG